MPNQSIAVVHLDESCLGNGREGDNPGGAGGLIEVRTGAGIERLDLFIHAPATTNNRMALSGAIAALQLLAQKETRFHTLIVSDSEYLVKGMREWMPKWRERNWTRKGGAIENLPLWKMLVKSAELHDVQWTWVRGHRGHPKNEYADMLAVRAATDQTTSDGLVESGFDRWFADQQARKRFPGYDSGIAFAKLEEQLATGESFPLSQE